MVEVMVGVIIFYDTQGFARGPGMGRGRGRGRARGFGYGRGHGWGYNFPTYTPTYIPYSSRIVQKISPENQLTVLKQEKEFLELEMKGMKSAIDDISKRITDFEKEE